MRFGRYTAMVAAFGVAAPASAQLMVVDSSGDRVCLFDQEDGSVIDLDWLSDAGAVGWAFSTPKEAAVVGDEIWVADQLEDAIHRFAADGVFLSTITEGPGGQPLNNIRSLGVTGDTVYVTNADAPLNDAIVIFSSDGTPMSSFAASGAFSLGCFDAEPFNGEILVSNADSDALQRYTESGAFLGNFASGYAYLEQVVVLDDGSVLTANAIDSVGIEGIYHFNADGSVRAYLDTAAINTSAVIRGANVLNNGGYLVSTSAGVWTYVSGVWTEINGDINGQYITVLSAGDDACAPDLTDDGNVDTNDFFLFLTYYQNQDPRADFSAGGGINTNDFFAFLAAYQAGC